LKPTNQSCLENFSRILENSCLEQSWKTLYSKLAHILIKFNVGKDFKINRQRFTPIIVYFVENKTESQCKNIEKPILKEKLFA